MKKFKLLIVLNCILMTFLFSNSCFAQSNKNDEDSVKFANLSAKYNVEIKDAQIPEGVTPVKYDSIDDFEKDLAKLNKLIENNEKQIIMQKKGRLAATQNTENIMISSDDVEDGYQSKAFWLGGTPLLPPMKMNVGVEYKYSGNVFYSCEEVDSWVTGVTFPVGFEYEQKSYDDDIIDGGRTLAVTVRGPISAYVIVNGIGKFITYNYTQYAEFYNP